MQVDAVYISITLYSKYSAFLQHHFLRYCIQTSYLGKICYCLSHFSQNLDQNGFWGENSQKLNFPILLYRKLNFVIFARAGDKMTSQKQKTEYVSTLFGINV